jgi:hypothetical protein
MCHPIFGQGKDKGKIGIKDGQREDQESCHILGRNVKNRDHFCDTDVGMTSIKTAN